MKALAVTLTLLSCAACAAGDHGGVANYDALRTARADCAARGGELQLRREGNPRSLDAYVCRRK